TFAQQTRATATQFAGKVSELEDDILPGTGGRCWSRRRSCDVVRRQEHNGKTDLAGVALEFLYDCQALTGLLLKNDGFELNLLEKAGHSMLRTFVVSVHDEHLVSWERCSARLRSRCGDPLPIRNFFLEKSDSFSQQRARMCNLFGNRRPHFGYGDFHARKDDSRAIGKLARGFKTMKVGSVLSEDSLERASDPGQ